MFQRVKKWRSLTLTHIPGGPAGLRFVVVPQAVVFGGVVQAGVLELQQGEEAGALTQVPH